MERKWILIAVALAAVLLVGVGGTYYYVLQPTAKPREQTLVIAYADCPGKNKWLDPGVSNPHMPHSGEVIANVMERLVGFEYPECTEIEGRLATSWTTSSDGKIYTFELRQGVKFHDGTPFNASAVKFSLERSFEGNKGYIQGLITEIDKIEIVDDYTVRIVLTDSYAPLLRVLTHWGFSIYSPTAVQKYGEDFWKNIVGTGPFKLESLIPEETTVLVKNEEYWRGPPKLDKIIIKVVTTWAAARIMLETGEIDMCHVFNSVYWGDMPKDVSAMEANPEIEVIEAPSLAIRYVGINTAKEPWTDIRLRKAIAYALDYDSFIDDVMWGAASRAYSLIPPTMFSSDPDVQPKYDKNLTRAKELLAEAGYPNGEGFPKLTLLYFSPQTVFRDKSIVIQQNLAELGIESDIVGKDFGPAIEDLLAGRFDLYPCGMTGPGINYPDILIYTQYHSSLIGKVANYFAFGNPEVDAALESGRRTTDVDEQLKAYEDFQALTNDLLPAIPTYTIDLIIYHRTDVHGLPTTSPAVNFWLEAYPYVYKE